MSRNYHDLTPRERAQRPEPLPLWQELGWFALELAATFAILYMIVEVVHGSAS